MVVVVVVVVAAFQIILVFQVVRVVVPDLQDQFRLFSLAIKLILYKIFQPQKIYGLEVAA
jgi:hypothetical protein